MLRNFVLAAMLGYSVAQTTPTPNRVSGVVAAQESPLEAYTNKNVTFSFALQCTTSCFLNSGTGVFNRVAFREALGAAYNSRAETERAKMIATLTAELPNLSWEEFAAATYFQLSTTYPDSNPSIYNNIMFDRVVEDTRGTVPTLETADGTSVSESTYWNVFLRLTMTEIPEAIANDFEPVIMQALTNFGQSAVLTDSIWVDTTAYFITDQLEPVVGRGHKSQRLLIPLILGVACMLIVPIVMTALAVSSQKRKLKSKSEVDAREKDIVQLQRNLAVNEGYIQTYAEREDEFEATKQRKLADVKARDEYELTEKDVDWKSA